METFTFSKELLFWVLRWTLYRAVFIVYRCTCGKRRQLGRVSFPLLVWSVVATLHGPTLHLVNCNWRVISSCIAALNRMRRLGRKSCLPQPIFFFFKEKKCSISFTKEKRETNRERKRENVEFGSVLFLNLPK